MNNPNHLSDCHKAPISVRGNDEGTSYYVCGTCHKPCDLYTPNQPDILEILKRESHRIGAHSDDWGGDSDKPCYCTTIKQLEQYISKREVEARIDELLKTCTKWEYGPDLPATYLIGRTSELNALKNSQTKE